VCSAPFLRVNEPKKTGDILRNHKGRHPTETVEQRKLRWAEGRAAHRLYVLMSLKRRVRAAWLLILIDMKTTEYRSVQTAAEPMVRIVYRPTFSRYTVKKVSDFLSLAGMALTKLSLP
jgi:hypothetical protein